MSLPHFSLIRTASLTASLIGTIGLVLGAGSAIAQTADVVIPTESGSRPPSTGGTQIPTEGPSNSSGSGATGSTTDSTIPTTGGTPLNSVRFSCRQDNGRDTVMYQPESQPGQFYAWAVPQQMGGGWTTQRRCQEISRRLESYRPDGLVEMQTAVENGYNIVCVTTDKDPSCRIVFTVPNGQDPIATRNSVFQNLAIADSGQQTAGVFTYRDGQPQQVLGALGKALNVDLGGLFGKPSPAWTQRRSNGMPLKPFLDRADGGTGSMLKQRSTATQRQGLRLRDVFR